MQYSIKTDQKWRKRWEAMKLGRFNPKRMAKKLYCLEMFSYPSGAKLHIGHWYNYSLTDSWARMKRMQGYEVFQPMGFDAFGLPAENYAIKTGIHPMDSTLKNIETMEEQLKAMGGMFDWDHELATCMPEYYRWNQWLFLQLYKKGLAYRKKAPVNWCPKCNTVLANEQVYADGSCERCGNQVTKKHLTQWFFKITDYAQELLDCLPQLKWPERTKKIQTNWIGRSEGAEIVFQAEKNGQILRDAQGQAVELRVFTTRADTLYGVSYVVVAPEAELCDLLTTEEQREAVNSYQEATRRATEIDRMSSTREKTGVFTGSYAIHPLTGQRVPVWTSDYVIASYGTGVVMAVPAHDERDFAFAERFNLPIQRVIVASDGNPTELPFCDEGKLVNSAEFDSLESATARQAIIAKLEPQGLGQMRVNYRLRDWLVSRQRYWGTPIPMIYCEHCGEVPVPEDQLPVKLPYDVEFTPDGESPLKKCRSFIETTCPICGRPAERDPDTLDTFVCSSWYQMRYVDNKNEHQAFDPDLVNQLCPVDMYVGGAEHAAMHLLYARFITKALRDMGYVNFDEPFSCLVHQGTILGSDGQKMSKSLGNTVSPDEYVEQYGSDVFRLYLAFGFAYTEGGPWSDDGIKAIARFVSRVSSLLDRVGAAGVPAQSQASSSAAKELNYALHYTIKSVSEDAERFQFNTSVARLMELLNALNKYQDCPDSDPAFLRYVSEQLLLLLAPFAPHFAEEAWESLGHTASIFNECWPSFDEAAMQKDEVEIAVQLNGKIVSRLNVPTEADDASVMSLVEALPDWTTLLAGRQIVKKIYIKGRLLNLVVK